MTFPEAQGIWPETGGNFKEKSDNFIYSFENKIRYL